LIVVEMYFICATVNITDTKYSISAVLVKSRSMIRMQEMSGWPYPCMGDWFGEEILTAEAQRRRRRGPQRKP
jgi:hypothetical protein